MATFLDVYKSNKDTFTLTSQLKSLSGWNCTDYDDLLTLHNCTKSISFKLLHLEKKWSRNLSCNTTFCDMTFYVT